MKNRIRWILHDFWATRPISVEVWGSEEEFREAAPDLETFVAGRVIHHSPRSPRETLRAESPNGGRLSA